MPTARPPARFTRPQGGFTLIEMGVVIFIMAILLGSILVPLSNQVEQRQLVDTQRQLEELREAVIGYALAQAKPALPCPDKTVAGGNGTPNDGMEDVNADGTCVQNEGNAPWRTLGLTGVDAWGHRIRYRVSPAYAQHTNGINLDSGGDLRLCADLTTSGTCDAITEATEARNKPAAVLISHGPNGWGSIDSVTNTQILPPGCASIPGCAQVGTNEIANADGDIYFVSRPPNPGNSGATQFDDIVAWLSPHVLKQRLVAGGRLP